MKLLFPITLRAAFGFLASGTALISAESHQLIKKWETPATLKTPESVLYDASGKVLYVSNIDGKEPWAKDGAGSIAKVGLDGKVIAAEWVKGLEAPKGLGLYKGQLYVADIDQVVVIDVAKAAIVQAIPIIGAQGLNDISIDKAGVVYVTDSRAKKLHAIVKGTPTVVLENLKSPNGVLARGADVFVLDAGGLYKVGKDKALIKIADGMEGNTDGVENVSGDDFIVSCWRGVIYYVNAKGEKQQLLDTRAQEINSADIGYNAKARIVYVPTFFKNSVVAYELK